MNDDKRWEIVRQYSHLELRYRNIGGTERVLPLDDFVDPLDELAALIDLRDAAAAAIYKAGGGAV